MRPGHRPMWTGTARYDPSCHTGGVTEVVIELDPSDEPAAQEPPRRPSAARVIRPWLAACVLVACLLTLGAAGAGPQSLLNHVTDLRVPAVAELVSAGNQLLISDETGLTSLEPSTGAPRWHTQLPVQRPYVRAEGDLLILTGWAQGQDATPSTTVTMAVDAQTGDVRWRIPGALKTVGDLLVVHRTDDRGPLPVGELSVYDLAGRQIWSQRPVPQRHAIDRRRGLAITLDPVIGELVEYRLADGTVVSRKVEQLLVGSADIYTMGEFFQVSFSDGGYLFQREGGFVPSDQLNVPEMFAKARLERADCGQVWCEYSPFRGGVQLIDKASGALRHDGEEWELVMHTDFGVVGTGVASSATRRSKIDFFDPATGRLQELPEGWNWLDGEFAARVVRRAGPLVFVNPMAKGTYLGLLDAAGMRVVGFVPQLYLSQCMAKDYTLACRVDPQTLRVWHLGVRS